MPGNLNVLSLLCFELSSYAKCVHLVENVPESLVLFHYFPKLLSLKQGRISRGAHSRDVFKHPQEKFKSGVRTI